MTNENGLGEENLNAAQVDAQRARHLLDRALGLSERDDLDGAIVVCRQALALAPHQSQGWSMLGLLYERTGDIDGAIEAYGKVLELSPASTLERESLQRLRQRKGPAPRPAPAFHFDNAPNTATVPGPASIADYPLEASSASTRGRSFYFRSLPFILASVACLLVLIAAQRSAFHRRHVNRIANPPAQVQPNNAPAATTPGATANNSATPAAPSATDLPPTALAPQVSHTMPEQTTSGNSPSQSAAPSPAATPVSPVPRPDPAPTPRPARTAAQAKPKPKPKPKPASKPRPSTPTEMPVLPRPKITLPQRTAPAPEPETPASTAPTSNNRGQFGNGPVDVGDSEDSNYIPINPPSFPNASRD